MARKRLCMVGAGRVGRLHTRNLTEHAGHRAEIAAIVDPERRIAEELAADYDVPLVCSSLDEALERGDLDGAVITTPTFTHHPLAVQAFEAGLHVHLEKPMAMNLRECAAITAAAERAGTVLQIGFMRRFDLEFRAARRRIEAGEIGRPMLIKSLTHGPGLPPPWACDPRLSNGMLAEVNSHDWDAVRWLMGSNPARVMAETANFKGPSRGITDPDFYDNVLVSIRFESGALGSISGVCPCDYGYDARVEIVGEKGIMQIGELRGQAVLVCTDRETGLLAPVHRTWPERFAWAYICEMEHFLDCIRRGSRPDAGGIDGRWAVAGVLAGTRSFQQERPVRLSEVLG
jgi:myo-inositol 2-dehydrogenase / D-chiro-inositol 1-dehydrogenase